MLFSLTKTFLIYFLYDRISALLAISYAHMSICFIAPRIKNSRGVQCNQWKTVWHCPLHCSVNTLGVFLVWFCFLIYFWLRWVFVAACRLSLVVVSGGYSSLHCMGFSWRWLLLLQSMGCRRAGFNSCGTWAQ